MKDAVLFVPAGVKLAVLFVPAAVSVCVCVESADPEKVGVLIVPAGVPALTAAVDPLRVAAEAPDAEAVKSFTVVPLVASARVPAPCECVPSADPVKVGVLTVPAGVPALTALVVTELPVKVSAGTVPADPVKICAGTVPGVPLNTGVPIGQEIVSAGIVPGVPVKVGAATDPAGVKAAGAFVPAGVTLLDPPPVPTSP